MRRDESDLSSLVVGSNTACTSRVVAQLPGIDKVLISTSEYAVA